MISICPYPAHMGVHKPGLVVEDDRAVYGSNEVEEQAPR